MEFTIQAKLFFGGDDEEEYTISAFAMSHTEVATALEHIIKAREEILALTEKEILRRD